MYVETSAPQHTGDKARLVSPTIQLGNGQQKCFYFYYSMYGANVDHLNIYVMKGTQLGTVQWTRSRTQGPSWHLGELTINGPGPLKVS